jgi:hypothetical protein
VNTCTFENSTDFVPRNFRTKFFVKISVSNGFFLQKLKEEEDVDHSRPKYHNGKQYNDDN